VIVGLTAANLRGLDMGRRLQNSFTIAKVASLVLLIALGCLLFPNAAAIHANFGSAGAFVGGTWNGGFLSAFGAAMVGGLFSADAWATVTFTAAEVKNPRRNLPLALALGSGGVILLYLLANVAYLCELPAAGAANASTVWSRGIAHATSDRVAAAAMEMVWSRGGASLTAVLVMISAFGCANGLILTGARVTYAMAGDGVFFAAASRLNRVNVPAVALIIQGAWASVLALSGTYSDLLDYVVFAQLLFYVLTVGAVFVLRWTRPAASRPYRTWGYPWLPATYIVAASVLMLDLLIVRPRFTWLGLLIVVAGIPIYSFAARRTRRTIS